MASSDINQTLIYLNSLLIAMTRRAERFPIHVPLGEEHGWRNVDYGEIGGIFLSELSSEINPDILKSAPSVGINPLRIPGVYHGRRILFDTSDILRVIAHYREIFPFNFTKAPYGNTDEKFWISNMQLEASLWKTLTIRHTEMAQRFLDCLLQDYAGGEEYCEGEDYDSSVHLFRDNRSRRIYDRVSAMSLKDVDYLHVLELDRFQYSQSVRQRINKARQKVIDCLVCEGILEKGRSHENAHSFYVRLHPDYIRGM